jgi:hypothetical protein
LSLQSAKLTRVYSTPIEDFQFHSHPLRLILHGALEWQVTFGDTVQIKRNVHIAFLSIAIAAFGAGLVQQGCAQTAAVSGGAVSIPEAERVQPAAVAKLLQSPESERPLLIHVGFRIMFSQEHIPGSVYAGPGSQPAGLKALENVVAAAPKNKLVIIYCGCCPWTKCPNMGPAFKHLRELGFTNVKAIYMANNFGDDWVAMGFPVAQGQ